MAPLRVIVADDSVLVREGVIAIINSFDTCDVVASCPDKPSLLDAVATEQPDVVVTDIRMPPTGGDEGIDAARTIRAGHPDIGVVVLSQFADPDYVLRLLEGGSEGLGYLLKDRLDLSELERAIAAVADGGSVVDTRVVEVLVHSRNRGASTLDRLTPRETEVLTLIAEGLNNAGIAERLVLSDKAVAKHINSIFSKLGLGVDDQVHRRVKAVLLWLADGQSSSSA